MRTSAIIGLTVAGLLATTAVARAAFLESPAEGATLSGIGFISGWKCNGGNITVTIDDGEPLPVAMGQERDDLRPVCGTIHHGFIAQINWALLDDGEHTAVAYDNGIEFDRATFVVGTTGEKFLSGVGQQQTVIGGFPTPGQSALLEWNESTQHFEIRMVWGSELSGYDRVYWAQLDADLISRTYRDTDFLYEIEPDVDTCQAGALSQAAKDRALDVVNEIRALHGFTEVSYSELYDHQVQEAALIQGTRAWPSHFPEPSDKCYTEAGAAGSASSNIAGWAGNTDPAAHMLRWLASAGHRRWLLNPFAAYMSYGQVNGAAALKVFGFDEEPTRTPLVEVEYVAFPYQTCPPRVMKGDPPWSFSVIENKNSRWRNTYEYFEHATIRVTRVSDGAELGINNRYTTNEGAGVGNFLSWKVEYWDYDTLYEVEIANVAMQSGDRRDYVYEVFIERNNLWE